MSATDLIRLPRQRLVPIAAVARRIAFAIGLILFVGVVTRINAGGYVDSAGGPIGFLDALYCASVTVTTTGYGDISAVTDGARLASILLIMPARILFLILVVGTTVEVLTDQSREYLATRRWRKNVQDHVVICGFGSTGRAAARELIDRDVDPDDIVVVDIDQAAVEEALRLGHVAVLGNATQNAVLDQASIDTAKATVVAPNRDDTAVLITLTIRDHNPQIHLVAAGREQENLHLLTNAGADEVIDATATVGRMLGLATTSPGSIAALNNLLDASEGAEELRQLGTRAAER